MSFLPNSYVFNTQNVLTPKRTILGLYHKQPMALIFCAVALICIVLAIFCFILNKIYKNKIRAFTHGIGNALGAILLIAAFLILLPVFVTQQYPAYALNCDFKLHDNSNLIARQDKNHRPFGYNEKQAYPYRLYVKNTANNNQLIYLGQANKQKEIFLDDNSKTSELFASYCNFIKKHNLSDKFKQKLYFIRDNSVTDANGIAQYVLKGDGITLKMKPDKKHAYQIYAVNE